MKLSVSLTDDDVATLDEYVRTAGLPSRSAAVQQAVRRLRHEGLQQAYTEACAEWDASGERAWWEVATVVPLTSSTSRVWPFQVLLAAEDTGLHADSKAQAEQVRSVAVERVGGALGGWEQSAWPRSTRRCACTWRCDGALTCPTTSGGATPASRPSAPPDPVVRPVTDRRSHQPWTAGAA